MTTSPITPGRRTHPTTGRAPSLSRRRFVTVLLAGSVAASTALLGGCAPSSTDPAATGSGRAADSPTAASSGAGTPTAQAASTEGASGVLDPSTVHDIAVTFDEDAYDAMIQTFQSTGEKEWIEATVTVDGTTYEQVGLRLKGNSSLKSLSSTGGGDANRNANGNANGNRTGGGPGGNVSVDAPQGLPWLIRFDKFVEDQAHDGLEELVIRSNTSATSLNEAVALDLLDQAGLATPAASSTSFSVNGGTAALRLAVENPDGPWVDRAFGTDGSLYKAESTGDYSYRGDDPAAYDDVFDLEAGDDEDLEHLTEFLQFINESDDATFASELPSRLDVDSFATYLAMQELVDNFDDIDGPGNNSYLYFDPASGQMTVVPWDMNLAFGAGPGGGMGGPGGGMGGPGGGTGGAPGGAPRGAAPRGGFEAGRPGGGFGRSNTLVTRFLANPTFAEKMADAKTRLQADLFDSGAAEAALERRAEVLSQTSLVSAATIASEKQQIAATL